VCTGLCCVMLVGAQTRAQCTCGVVGVVASAWQPPAVSTACGAPVTWSHACHHDTDARTHAPALAGPQPAGTSLSAAHTVPRTHARRAAPPPHTTVQRPGTQHTTPSLLTATLAPRSAALSDHPDTRCVAHARTHAHQHQRGRRSRRSRRGRRGRCGAAQLSGPSLSRSPGQTTR
jgi:hypothetical protein